MAAPGWYPDPYYPQIERWWDGQNWGWQTRPRPAPFMSTQPNLDVDSGKRPMGKAGERVSSTGEVTHVRANHSEPPQDDQGARPAQSRTRSPRWLLVAIVILALAALGVELARNDSSRSTSNATTARTTFATPQPTVSRAAAPAVPPTSKVPTVSQAPATAKPPAPTGPPAVGRSYRDGKFEFTVNSWDGTTVNLTVRNIGDRPQFLNTSAQYLYDTQDRRFEPSGDISSDLFLATLNPGQSVSGSLSYVLTGATPAYFELHDSMFSGGVRAPLR